MNGCARLAMARRKPYFQPFEAAALTRPSACFVSFGRQNKGLGVRIGYCLVALFMLIAAVRALAQGIQTGHLMAALPGVLVFSLIGGFLAWREWMITTDRQFAAYQAEIDSLPWEEAMSAAQTFFLACIVLFVLSLAFASLEPQIMSRLNLEALLMVPLGIAPVGAILVGICRFFWWR